MLSTTAFLLIFSAIAQASSGPGVSIRSSRPATQFCRHNSRRTKSSLLPLFSPSLLHSRHNAPVQGDRKATVARKGGLTRTAAREELDIPEDKVSSEEKPKWLTRRIMQQTSAYDVLDFAKTRIDDLNEIHLVAALGKIAYLEPDWISKPRNANEKEGWTTIWQKLGFLVPALDAKGVSSLLRSSMRLKYVPTNDILIALQEQALATIDGFTAKDCVTFWEAFANFQIQPDEQVMEALDAQLLLKAEEIEKYKMVSTCTWALRQLDYEPSTDLLHALYQRKTALPERRIAERIIKSPDVSSTLRIATENLQMLSSKDVVTCINHLSKLDQRGLRDRTVSYEDLDRFDLISSLFPMVIPRLDGAGLVILAHSLAKLGIPLEGEALDVWGERIVSVSGSLSAEDVSKSLWSYAMWRMTPSRDVLEALTARGSAIAVTFNSHDYTNTFWACSVLNRNLLQTAAPVTTNSMDGTLEISGDQNAAASYGGEESLASPAELMGMIRGLRRALQRTAAAAAHDFGAKPVARILWSFAKDGTAPVEPLMDALLSRMPQVINEGKPNDIALMIWSLAKLRHEIDPKLMDVIVTTCIDNAPNFFSRELRTLQWALPVLGKTTGIQVSNVVDILQERASEIMGPDGSDPSGGVQLYPAA